MKQGKRNSQSDPGKRSHFDQFHHLTAIVENALPLMKRKREFGFPFLRTRGEREGITVELTLRLEIDDCNPRGVPMPVLRVENNTFEDDVQAGDTAGVVVDRRTYNALVAAHEHEVKIIKDALGEKKFKLLQRVETSMHENGRLTNTFLYAPLSACRELVKRIEAHTR